MMSSIVWVVIANVSYAQIFEVKGNGRHIKKIHNLDNPEGRKKASEIFSDKPGRAFDRFGEGRHAMEAKVDLRERQQQTFSHQIYELIKKGKETNQFDELMIIAPPHFIGDLTATFPDSIKKLVIKEHLKDLPSYLKEQEVVDYMCKHLDFWNNEKYQE